MSRSLLRSYQPDIAVPEDVFILEASSIYSSNFLQPLCHFVSTSVLAVSTSPQSVSAEILQQLLPALSMSVCMYAERKRVNIGQKDSRVAENLYKSQQQQFSACATGI